MIYKKSSQGCSSSWLWSAPTDGVGLVSCDVFLVGELVLVFWLMELDLVSLKGSEVSSSRFWGVCEFSISLGNPSGFGSVQSVQFSHLVVSNSLQPHELQHVRPPCPSPTPRVHPNHVHRVGDAIQPSHPLSSPYPPALDLFQHQGLFQ